MKKKQKPKIKYDNVLLVICISIFVLLLLIIGIMAVGIIKDIKGSKAQSAEIVDSMEDYGYHLTDNNTDYFKKLYYQLKDLLSGDKNEDFEQEYAKLVAQLFVADFYDLNSKLDKTDVGGIQFVWKPYQEEFKNFATDPSGIYYYIENNLSGKRTQSLPSVKEVNVESIDSIHYSEKNYNDEKAYRVTLSISYKKDLGYPENCTLILLHNQNKLEIIEMK